MSFTCAAWKENIGISSIQTKTSTRNSRFFSKRKHISIEGKVHWIKI